MSKHKSYNFIDKASFQVLFCLFYLINRIQTQKLLLKKKWYSTRVVSQKKKEDYKAMVPTISEEAKSEKKNNRKPLIYVTL